MGDFFRTILDHAQAHFHIGLTGTKPYLANQHILNLARRRTGHRQRLGIGVGSLRFKIHHPFAVLTRRCVIGLSCE